MILPKLTCFICKSNACPILWYVRSTCNFKVSCRSVLLRIGMNFDLIQALTVISQIHINIEGFFSINDNLTWIACFNCRTLVYCNTCDLWSFVINITGNDWVTISWFYIVLCNIIIITIGWLVFNFYLCIKAILRFQWNRWEGYITIRISCCSFIFLTVFIENDCLVWCSTANTNILRRNSFSKVCCNFWRFRFHNKFNWRICICSVWEFTMNLIFKHSRCTSDLFSIYSVSILVTVGHNSSCRTFWTCIILSTWAHQILVRVSIGLASILIFIPPFETWRIKRICIVRCIYLVNDISSATKSFKRIGLFCC